MAALVWDADGAKRFETGVDKVALYVKGTSTAIVDPRSDVQSGDELGLTSTPYTGGVAWNGVTSVSKSPSGAEANDIYADNIKYASLRSAETFGATVEAYTYPDEFRECNGAKVVAGGLIVGQQIRKPFGFCFRTDIGDDSDSGIDVGSKYKLHLVYNATASPSEESFSTINDSPEAITFSWEMSTIPVAVTTDAANGAFTNGPYAPVATLTIDSSKLTTAGKSKLTQLESVLFGTTNINPMLPMPGDIIRFFGG